MTADEWDRHGDPSQMRPHIRCRPYPLVRWVWFNLACVERVADLLDFVGYTNYLRELVNSLGGSTAQRPRLDECGASNVIREASRRRDPLRWARMAAYRAVNVVEQPTMETAVTTRIAVRRRPKATTGSLWTCHETRYQAALLRDIYGNPFRPVAFDPDWRTSAEVALARTMYESRDFAPMPVLADALEDTGCTDPDVIAHCRGPGPHVRGCWVADRVLGKS